MEPLETANLLWSISFRLDNLLRRCHWDSCQERLEEGECLLRFMQRYLVSCSSDRYKSQPFVLLCPPSNLLWKKKNKYIIQETNIMTGRQNNEDRFMCVCEWWMENYLVIFIPGTPWADCCEVESVYSITCRSNWNHCIRITTITKNTEKRINNKYTIGGIDFWRLLNKY